MKHYAILKSPRYSKALLFSSVNMTNSEFLHNILCELSPGNNYTVEFTDKYPRASKTREWYYGPQREVDLPDFSSNNPFYTK